MQYEGVNFDIFCWLVGFLWLIDLLAYLPMFTVFFGKIEERGYEGENSTYTRKLKLAWLAAGLSLMFGNRLFKLAASCFFYILYRHYYIDTRWSSIRRGAGAPGFMSHWTALYLVLLQLSAFLDASGKLPNQIWWVMQIDFAVIMICAGTYKYMVGYLHHDGMEYGCVNPLWGYFWPVFLKLNPGHWWFRAQNWLASGVEFAAGVMMLFPPTRVIGAIAISLSFLYVALLIRLGRLAWLMSVLPLCYFPGFGPSLSAGTPFHLQTPETILQWGHVLIWVFLALLPLVKFMQYYNLFANRSLPEPLQKWVSTYANKVPLIMWRVFTPDVTNFYIRIYEENPERPILDESVLTLRNWKNPLLKLRFWHVSESIASVSVFTTLKYFPSNRRMFEDKLLKYSQSIQHALGRPVEKLRYEYVSIHKLKDRFVFVHVGNFRVDFDTHQVSEEKLQPDFDFTAPSKFSPVRESANVGSFTPK
ncbi:MAG: hypothetical protein KF760_30340 [Candidatus Eremiobacteraeota bacterium]|nr:hypothetical protein [Candidatus Eremiobacteraeota bacterium]